MGDARRGCTRGSRGATATVAAIGRGSGSSRCPVGAATGATAGAAAAATATAGGCMPVPAATTRLVGRHCRSSGRVRASERQHLGLGLQQCRRDGLLVATTAVSEQRLHLRQLAGDVERALHLAGFLHHLTLPSHTVVTTTAVSAAIGAAGARERVRALHHTRVSRVWRRAVLRQRLHAGRCAAGLSTPDRVAIHLHTVARQRATPQRHGREARAPRRGRSTQSTRAAGPARHAVRSVGRAAGCICICTTAHAPAASAGADIAVRRRLATPWASGLASSRQRRGHARAQGRCVAEPHAGRQRRVRFAAGGRREEGVHELAGAWREVGSAAGRQPSGLRSPAVHAWHVDACPLAAAVVEGGGRSRSGLVIRHWRRHAVVVVTRLAASWRG